MRISLLDRWVEGDDGDRQRASTLAPYTSHGGQTRSLQEELDSTSQFCVIRDGEDRLAAAEELELQLDLLQAGS